jgi:hypothetical protein
MCFYGLLELKLYRLKKLLHTFSIIGQDLKPNQDPDQEPNDLKSRTDVNYIYRHILLHIQYL